MVLGVIIAIGVAAVIVFIIIKLIRSSNLVGHVENTKQCIVCGRKTNSLICPFCKKDSKSLR